MNTYLEICISPDRDDLFEALKKAALNNNLEYEESSCGIAFDSAKGDIKIISKNIRICMASLVVTGSVISPFVSQIQPTIQELIKANASKSIVMICGDKKIEIKGNNDIKDALNALQELGCNPNP
jgi:hypothetical protein